MIFFKHTIYALLFLTLCSFCTIIILELQSFSSLRSIITHYFPLLAGRRIFLSNFFMGICASSFVSLIPAVLDYRSKLEAFLQEMKLFYATHRKQFLLDLGNESHDFIIQQHLSGNVERLAMFCNVYSKRFVFNNKLLNSLFKNRKTFTAYNTIASTCGKLSVYYQMRLLYHDRIIILNDAVKMLTKQECMIAHQELEKIENELTCIKETSKPFIMDLDKKIVDLLLNNNMNWYMDNIKMGD